MPTSPAQQCLRDLKSECNEMKRLTVQALLSGENYLYEDVIGFFTPVLEQYYECLQSIEDVDEKWFGRGDEYVTFTVSEIIRKYTEKREELESTTPAIPEEFDPDRILGFPVISHSSCLAKGGRVRGQILLTVDELADYIAPIPVSVISGIVKILDGNGNTVGFSICGQKNS